MRRTHVLTCFVAVFGVLMATGCTNQAEQSAVQQEQLNQQVSTIESSWESLRTARMDVAAKRDQLAELQAVARPSDEQQQQIGQLETEIANLESTIGDEYDALQAQLADFLTVALNEFPEAAETERGLEIYSEETIQTAAEHVRNTGNYAKAIDLLKTASGYYESIGLPPYPALAEKKAEFDDWRYVTEERWGQVKKGMTEGEIMETLGVPYYLNKKEDPDTGITFWLYPKRNGGAAAVYFNKAGKVYNTNFEAVPSASVAG